MNKKLLKILSGQWAIEPKSMEALCSSDFGDPAWKESNEPNHKNNVDIQNGIAVLHIDGALTYRSNIWKAWFGVDTYNSIENAFNELVADESVKGIVLSIDSPGGEIKGVSDLADRIFAARGTKECGIVAHSAGAMCSAAYWIASACEKVVASGVAQVGSIGVMGVLSGDEDKSVTYLRSSLSPNKNLDPNTPEGRSAVEKNLDAMAKVFVEALAKNRNSDFDSVLERYGQGKVFVGQEALEAGMVDAIDSLDSVVEKMIKHQTIGGNMPTNQTPAQTPAAQATVDVDAVRQEAVAAERTRIAGISSAFEGLGLDGDCKKFIAEGKTVDEAKAFCLEACKKQLAESKTAAPSASATPANPAADPAATAGLTAEQKALIAQGMAAGAAAANSVQAGTAEPMSDADKRAFDAFAAGAKNFR
jgi:ClpP class serine protease